MPSKRKIVRSAKTGKFAPKRKAKTAPATHVTESLPDKTLSPFVHDIMAAINSNSMDMVCDTPDFILASFLEDCLRAFERATKARKRRFGRK